MSFSKITIAIAPLVLLLVFCQNSEQPTAAAAAKTAAAPLADEPSPVQKIEEDLDYLTGKFEPEQHPKFVKIRPPHTDKTGMLLRREAAEAFQKMSDAARREGIQLNIISSTRNFFKQKTIWENKWQRYSKSHPDPVDRARKILEFSSMPGTSRHHWGTDVDLNDLTNEAFATGGKHEKVYRWLVENAEKYGFGQPYTAGRATGYHEERWHWSYLPLSQPFLKKFLVEMDDSKISGFEGSETASEIGAVKNYAGGINSELLEN